MESKVCTGCGQEKSLSDFGLNYGAPRGACKACISSRMKTYYLENREAILARAREYYVENEGAIKEKRRKYYIENKERIAEVQRAWRSNNPAIVNARRMRRARQVAAAGKFSLTEWNELKNMYGNRCLRCGVHSSYRPLTIDHITPLVNGGTNTIDNIQPLCKPCNSRKNDKTIDFRLGSPSGASLPFPL